MRPLETKAEGLMTDKSEEKKKPLQVTTQTKKAESKENECMKEAGWVGTAKAYSQKSYKIV